MSRFLGRVVLGVGCLVVAGSESLHAETVQSPDGRLVVDLNVKNGTPTYHVQLDKQPWVAPSEITLQLEGVKNAADWKLVSSASRSEDSIWEPVVTKRTKVRNHFNERELTLAHPAMPSLVWKVLMRVYDDGFAYRYHLENKEIKEKGGEKHVVITSDASTINFKEDMKWWGYVVERAPFGPVKASELEGTKNYPLYAESPSGKFVGVTEAHLRDFAWAQFTSKRGENGFRVTGARKAEKVALPFSGSWKVVKVGDKAGVLIDSDMVINLNPDKADPKDYKWMKQGVSFWDWRAAGYTAKDGFKYALDLPSWKRFIDMAAEQKVPYLVIDADWYGPEFSKDSDPFTGGKAEDVKAAVKYGKSKGVGLILYLNHVAASKYGIEKIIRAYSEWGAAGIKYGFMNVRDPRAKVNWTHRVARLCNENKLIVNFHDGPIPPTGEEVQWPGFVHREFCHAQSDAKRVFVPKTFIDMAHVNMLAGPMDMNNGMFDLNGSEPTRPKIFVQVNSTITAEVARLLIAYGGGAAVIPDAADSYRRYLDAFQFISAQKYPWLESKTLNAKMSQYIAMMRQANDGRYMLGVVTNEEARSLKIGLDFLPKGKRYQAIILADKKDTHYIKNREAYKVVKREVSSTDELDVWMAPGGGCCVLFNELPE